MAGEQSDDEIETIETIQVWQKGKKWLHDGVKNNGQVPVGCNNDKQFWTLKKEDDLLWSISVVVDGKRLYVSYNIETTNVTLEEENVKERNFVIALSLRGLVFFKTPGDHARYLQDVGGFLQLANWSLDEIEKLEWRLTVGEDEAMSPDIQSISTVQLIGTPEYWGNQDIIEDDPIPVKSYTEVQDWNVTVEIDTFTFSPHSPMRSDDSFVTSMDGIKLLQKGIDGAISDFQAQHAEGGYKLSPKVDGPAQYLYADGDELALGSERTAAVWMIPLSKIKPGFFPFPSSRNEEAGEEKKKRKKQKLCILL